jgi:hypothetical protein
MPFLIVDRHVREQRREDLRKMLSRVDPAREVDVISELEGEAKGGEPLLAEVRDAVIENTAGRDIILLHCGFEQHLLPDALALFEKVPCLLYFGGSLPNSIVEWFREGTASPHHAVIPEALDVKGLREEQVERLEACARLILDDPQKPAREVVDETFGDEVLEKALKELYEAMRARKSPKDLIDLRDRHFGREPWEEELGGDRC